jgi:hypothetical protein
MAHTIHAKPAYVQFFCSQRPSLLAVVAVRAAGGGDHGPHSLRDLQVAREEQQASVEQGSARRLRKEPPRAPKPASAGVDVAYEQPGTTLEGRRGGEHDNPAAAGVGLRKTRAAVRRKLEGWV